MECNSLFRQAITFLIIVGFSLSASADSGSVRGIVRDQKTGETIIGANVVIQGTTIGVSTDVKGRFELNDLAAGSYNLLVSFISYQPVKIENVEIKRAETVVLDIELAEDIAVIDGVHVTARRTTNTDISLLSSIKNSELVVTGISAQQIRRSQDSDASMVIRRIPGVTVIADRFIMIRGLSERYNPTMMHFMPAPSMEADIRSFSFDIIPSSVIDQILVYKSPSAELPGEFGGGVVKIFTKSIPDETGTRVTYTTSYEQGSSLGSFYMADRGGNNFLGFNNRQFDLPSYFPGSLRAVHDPEKLTALGRSLENNWLPVQTNAGLRHSANVVHSSRFNWGRVEFGNTTSLSYSLSNSVENVRRIDYNLFDQNLQVGSKIFDFNDQQNTQNIRTGLLHNWAFSIGPNHSFEFKNFFNQISQSQYVFRSGNHFEFGYYANSHAFYQLYRGIYLGQLTGNHKFNEQRTTLDWAVGYGHSFRDEPDYRRFRSDLNQQDGSRTLYVPFGAAATYFMGRFYSEMSENNYNAVANLKHRFKFNQLPNFQPELMAGFFFEDKDRVFDARNLGYVRANSFLFNQTLLNVPIDSLFHVENINTTTGIRLDEQTNLSDSYSARNNLLAGYAQLSLPIGRFRISGGVRMENFRQRLNSFTFTKDPVVVDNPVLSVLPSANISFNFTDKMLVRTAYGKTVNRPEFRELAPFGFYDFNLNLVKRGNPDLKKASIHHFDLRWEYYPSPSELIMAGVFYKRFLSPIESSFIPGGGTAGIKTFSFSNAKAAESRGVEVEVRKSLQDLTRSDFVNRFTVLMNAALIQSNVELGDAGLGQRFTERPMQGQSPYIVNVAFNYNDPDRQLQVTTNFNVIGKRIFMIGFDDYPEIYEMPRNLLDITVTKGLRNNLELRLGARDLLSQEALLLQDGNQDGTFDRKSDQAIERLNPGAHFSVGLSWKL